MKKYIIILANLFLLIGNTFSQTCLTNGITFTSQEQIDNFKINHPNCNEIEGNVTIFGSSITNLDSLDVLEALDGYLWINNTNIISLSGIHNIAAIKGTLSIEANSSLMDLNALQNLIIVDGLEILDNDALLNLSGLENLTFVGSSIWIRYNENISNLNALSNVKSLGLGLAITDNNSLINFEGLENITSIGFSLIVLNNESLESFAGLENVTLIRRAIDIEDNPVLTDITDLSNVNKIGGSIFIFTNTALSTLEGLDNIDANSINSINILQNPSLSYCAVQSICDYISINAGGNFSGNATGCNSMSEIEIICGGGIINLESVLNINTPEVQTDDIQYESYLYENQDWENDGIH